MRSTTNSKFSANKKRYIEMNCKPVTYSKPTIPKGTRRFYERRFSLGADYQEFSQNMAASRAPRSGSYCGSNTV